MDLTLPKIEPARSYAGVAADAIDRAGAAVKQAADKTANVLAEDDKAQIAVQTQEATLQATKGLDTAMHVIRSNPYVNPDDYLGTGKKLEDVIGNVPGIDATEQVPGQGDAKVRQRRKYIPMHEIAPALFDHMSNTVTLSATQNIKEEPWQRNFARAMAQDVERKRAEMLDWQRGQRLADAEIKTEAQINQGIASRNWSYVRAVLDTPENQLGVAKRETYRENLPLIITEANIDDRLRSSSVEDLDKLRADIGANTVSKDPEKDGGFATKLSPQQQQLLSSKVDTRINEVLHLEEWKRKRAEEKKREDFGDNVKWAYNTAREQGVPFESIMSTADIPTDLSQSDWEHYKNFMETQAKQRQTDNIKGWLPLAEKAKNGSLAQMSKADLVFGYFPYLSDEHQRHWMDEWSKAQKGAKPTFSPAEDNLMDVYLRSKGFDDDKKNPQKADEFQTQKALLQQNLILWKRRNPDLPLDYNVLKTQGNASTFNTPSPRWFESSKVSKWVKSNLGDGDTQSALTVALESLHPGVAVNVQELEDHARKIEQEAPVVDEVWSVLKPKTALTGSYRAIVHGSIIEGSADRARIDAQLDAKNQLRASKGLPPIKLDDKARIAQVISNLPVEPAEREAASKNMKKLEDEAAGRQVVAAGEKAKAAQDARPLWERQADAAEKDALQTNDDQVYQQILGRLESEARKAGQMRPWYESRFGTANDVVSTEMQKRARAEAAETEQARHASIQSDFVRGRAIYQAFMADYERGDPQAVKLMSTGPYQSFGVWFNLWKQGKVR